MTSDVQGGFRILLVDDNPDEIDLARLALGQLDWPLEIETAINGSQAVDMIVGAVRRLDLVLLDLNLPLLSGLDVLKRVRAVFPRGSLPIIILTTSQDPKERARAIALECDEFHVKPLSYEKSVALFRDLLARWLPANGKS
jgi:CheY-like chemotaxis protein